MRFVPFKGMESIEVFWRIIDIASEGMSYTRVIQGGVGVVVNWRAVIGNRFLMR